MKPNRYRDCTYLELERLLFEHEQDQGNSNDVTPEHAEVLDAIEAFWFNRKVCN